MKSAERPRQDGDCLRACEMEPYVVLRRGEAAPRTLQLWEAADRPAGRDLACWLQAEVEWLSERQHCPSRWARAVNEGATAKPAAASTRSGSVSGPKCVVEFGERYSQRLHVAVEEHKRYGV
jgi:hypothetical protein